MSRSYRKPYVANQGTVWKKIYNQSLRQEEDIPNGNAYRKMRNSYNIDDYGWYLGDDPKWKRK
jgi:hypothetical protein